MSASTLGRRPTTARFEPRRLCHVNLYVGDLRDAVTFYRNLCGLTIVFDEPGVGAAFLSNGNSHHDLALMQASGAELVGRDGKVQKAATRGTTPGLNHLAWEMRTEKELVAAIAAAPQHGLEIQRTLDHLISKSAYLSDPDGVWHEFYSDSTKQWRELYQRMEDQLISAQWTPDLEAASAESFIDEDAELAPAKGAAMRSLRTSRAAVVVSDLAQSLDYYTRRIGLQIRIHSAGDGFAILGGRLGYADILLLQQQNPGEPLGLHHFGLEVESEAELEAGARRLGEAGLTTVHELRTDAGHAIVVHDPDGRSVEFFVVRGASPWDVRPTTDTERSFLL